MRTIQAVALALGLLLAPVGAAAQTAGVPAAPATDSGGWSTATMLAVGTGAVVGVVALNMVTGGTMLAPMVGPAVSNAVGGNMLGAAALSAPARQALCRTITVLATAAAGAGVGYWLVSE
jgi:hypothetical protein